MKKPILSLEQEALLILVVGLLAVAASAYDAIQGYAILPAWAHAVGFVLWFFWFLQWAAKGGIPPRIT